MFCIVRLADLQVLTSVANGYAVWSDSHPVIFRSDEDWGKVWKQHNLNWREYDVASLELSTTIGADRLAADLLEVC